MLHALVILNLLIVLAAAFVIGILRRKVARLDRDVQAVKQRLFEGGVELVEQIATEVRVPEAWKDLDGIPDEDIEQDSSLKRVHRETWLDNA